MTDAITPTFEDVPLRAGPLVLRAPGPADVPAIVRACRDPLTQQWLPLPNPYDETHALSFVTDLARATWRSGQGIVRAIEWDGEFAGMIDLKKTDWAGLTTEIGYWVSPDHRGRGLAGKAARLLGDWAMLQHGMERVEIRAATGNTGSRRAALAAGYREEGVLRSAGYIHTGRVDLVVLGKVRADL
ncbi:GNAT family N-acetyltransferase [Flexivirga oryzae]|uniref:RimJ/RimL family protein N-acetyltransferase n=1 Tax=Flexivirga oryzae TaxID=1794944 RepID=A0A839N789_9MICO|nr:RimJ/RimL family protein N-acetyltransferase [Flexivirga oryzae]